VREIEGHRRSATESLYSPAMTKPDEAETKAKPKPCPICADEFGPHGPDDGCTITPTQEKKDIEDFPPPGSPLGPSVVR